MNGAPKKCARPGCGKTVYPLEELKCLDKVWHKGCFKCTVCGMTLSMKNYKGYDKMPYCEPHYPKTVATVVADTPEMNRIRENTKVQSNVKYHEEFEKMKGKKTDVTDDPELTRHMKNMQVFSNAAYHNEMKKKTQMEHSRPPLEQTMQSRGPPLNNVNGTTHDDSPYSRRQRDAMTTVFASDAGGRVPPQQRPVGKIDDYDPMNGQWGSAAGSQQKYVPQQQHTQQMPARGPPPGGMAIPGMLPANTAPQMSTPQQQQPLTAQPPSPQQAIRPQQHSPKQVTGKNYIAIYDYTAADTDEVTFVEGDTIINCQHVDEGWMTGTVQRTKQWGMLPANYVEPLK